MSRSACTTIVTILLTLVLGTVSHADTITLRGTTISVPVRVERIASGRVFYVDHAGRSQHRSLEDVEHITFAALPQLADAAAAIDEDRYRDALSHLMQALLAAESHAQRLWIHARLARAHDLLGEYVQACSHFACVAMLEGHGYWRSIAPVSEPNEPHFAATEEALRLLRRARTEVEHPHLLPMIAQMIQRIEPIHHRLAGDYTGPPIEPGSTVSGIAREVILTARPGSLNGSTPSEVHRQPQATRHASPESIEKLLAAERWDEALAACEQASRNSAQRDSALLLHQHGRALLGAGRPRDAAIKFTRCAILFRGSPQASLSLIETAVIYRDTFDRHDTAARLLDRAEEEEHSHNREHIRQRIAQVRQSLQQPSAAGR